MGREKGYNTKQRDIILSFFRAHPGQCYSAKDLIADSSIVMGDATIFRCLSSLAEEGILSKYIAPGRSGALYQLGGGETCHSHFHLKCLCCGEIVHMDCSFMKDMEEHIESNHAFTIDPSKTVLYGLCRLCRKENQN